MAVARAVRFAVRIQTHVSAPHVNVLLTRVTSFTRLAEPKVVERLPETSVVSHSSELAAQVALQLSLTGIVSQGMEMHTKTSDADGTISHHIIAD